MREYVGWVPTITGQLSFSLVGSILKNGWCNNVQSGSNNLPHRRIALLQRREAKDAPLLVRLFNKDRFIHYIMIADTDSAVRPTLSDGRVDNLKDEIGVLKGRVMIILNHDLLLAHFADKFIRDLKYKISQVNRTKINFDFETYIFQSISETTSNIKKSYPTEELMVDEVSFTLNRNGELRIFDSKNINFNLLSQVYYFIKDSAHRHYHHDGSTDAILPLTEVLDGDDITWRRNTLWSLVKVVLECRRKGDVYSYKNALGVSAYAEAFQACLAKIKRSSCGNYYVLHSASNVYNFDHGVKSLLSKSEELKYFSSKNLLISQLFVATFLAFFAVVTSSIQAKDAICVDYSCPSVPVKVIDAITALYVYPYVFVFIILCCFMFSSRDLVSTVIGYTKWRLFIISWLDVIVSDFEVFVEKKFGINIDELIARTAAFLWACFTICICGVLLYFLV